MIPDSIATVLRWQSVADLAVLTGAIYIVIRWSRHARALRFAIGIGLLHLAALLSAHYRMMLSRWVFEGVAVLGVVMLVVVFQRELRRAFLQLDSRYLRRWRAAQTPAPLWEEVARAVFDLASERTGALIVVVGDQTIDEVIEGGPELDAAVSAGLLTSIFQKTSPLHDGAVILDAGRLRRVNVILPLTQRQGVPHWYGTRHRAGLGLSEHSDATVIVVSEEKGIVHVMREGQAHRVGPEQLVQLLSGLRGRDSRPEHQPLKRLLLANWDAKLGAFAFALLIWLFSYLTSAATVRIVDIPIEFTQVPAGAAIEQQSTTVLSVQLRGSEWEMDSIDFSHLVARFDLSDKKSGQTLVYSSEANLELPPGITVEREQPRMIEIEMSAEAEPK